MKNTIITLITTLLLGLSTSLVSYAYFTNKVEINNDLQITTGTFQTEVGDGMNTSLLPGQSSEYNYFDIKNTGSLNQNVIIEFINLNEELLNVEKDIFYELQIKNQEGEFDKVICTTLQELRDIKLRYFIPSNNQISFRTKIILIEDIDSQSYEKYIKLRLNVTSYQVNE